MWFEQREIEGQRRLWNEGETEGYREKATEKEKKAVRGVLEIIREVSEDGK